MRFALGLLSSIFVIKIVFAQTVTPNQLNLDLLSTSGTITISGPVGPSYLNPAPPSWLSFSGCDPTNFSNTCVFTVTADPAKITSYPASYSFVICSQLGTCTTKPGTITIVNVMPLTLNPVSPQTLNPSSTQTSAVSLAYNPPSSGTNQSSVELSLQTPLPSWLAWGSGTGNNSCSNLITLNANSSCQVILKVNGNSITQNDSYTLNYCLKKNSNICSSNPVTFTIEPFTISGQISGLGAGKSFTLQEVITPSSTPSPQSQQITITQNGSFEFTQGVSPESNYAISVNSQPAGQTCSVANSNGSVTNANITDIAVNCSASMYSVGGTVSGLANNETVNLQLNESSNTVSVTGEKPIFKFTNDIAYGSDYTVTVTQNPSGKTCTVTGSGKNITENITDIAVHCSTSMYSVGGTVSGLANNETVNLQLNESSNTVSVTGEKPIFTFTNEIAYGSDYTVTVTQNPAENICTVTGSGKNITENITDIAVTCIPSTTITATPSKQVLSVSGLEEFGIPDSTTGSNLSSGVARTIKLENTGNNNVVGLTITMPNNLPTGTKITSNCPSTLDNKTNNSCIITITPGGTPSSNELGAACQLGTEPKSSDILVSWNSGQSLTIPVYILANGCIYDGGYVFALDDTPAPDSQLQGKVVTTTDIFSATSWLPNSFSFCGISDTSTPVQANPISKCTGITTSCDGLTDGQCNTDVIMKVYTEHPDLVGVPTVATCANYSVNGISTWYLPAICELSYDNSPSRDKICGDNGHPKIQNIYDINAVSEQWASVYWSSTELTASPSSWSWISYFSSSPTGSMSPTIAFDRRTSNYAVRCVHKFGSSSNN